MRMLDPTSDANATASSARGRTVVLRDPRAIKALAHPARLAVIDEFFAGRRLTATECAEIAGLSASAMSYHLRALERWGIIRRSETTGDGRERPWEAVGDRLMIDPVEPRASAAGEAVLISRVLDRQRSELLSYLASKAETASAWYDAMSVSSVAYWLTQAEAVQLNDQVVGLLSAFDGRTSGADPVPPNARRVRVSVSVVPVPTEPADPAG
jgi:DNA-binding transcriptional ArsR family regulator